MSDMQCHRSTNALSMSSRSEIQLCQLPRTCHTTRLPASHMSILCLTLTFVSISQHATKRIMQGSHCSLRQPTSKRSGRCTRLHLSPMRHPSAHATRYLRGVSMPSLWRALVPLLLPHPSDGKRKPHPRVRVPGQSKRRTSQHLQCRATSRLTSHPRQASRFSLLQEQDPRWKRTSHPLSQNTRTCVSAYSLWF